jgi:hypothetical protein
MDLGQTSLIAMEKEKEPVDYLGLGADFFDSNEDGEGEGDGEGEEKTKTIHPQLSKGKGFKKIDWDVNPEWTVAEFKKELINNEGYTVPQGKEHTIDLIVNSKILKDISKLCDVGVNDDNSQITIYHHLNGGAQQLKRRVIDVRNPLLKGRGTRHVDCINGEDKLPRAKLPCGCAFCAETLFNHITSWFEKPHNDCEPDCPNCHKMVPWVVTACIAALSVAEYKKYSLILRRRKLQALSLEFSQCPSCETNVKRPESLGQNRVGCPVCRKYDFCFICSGKWNGNGMQVCGNTSCPMVDRQNVLDNSPLATISGKADVPVWRACPKCTQLCCWKKACSHMLCPDRKECKFEFCMICLQDYDGHKSPCEKKPKHKFT